MSNPDITLPSYYIRQIIEQVRLSGVPVEGWMTVLGISAAQLDQPQLTLSFTTLRRLVLDALALSREPGLALLVGARLQANTHGVLGLAAMSGGSIRQVIELIERFIGVRTTLVEVSHQVEGDEIRIRFTETLALQDIRGPVLEIIVLAIKNVLDFITMGSCAILRVAFPFTPTAYDALARELFRCDIVYEAGWTGFALPLAVIDQPLRMADPGAFQDAARICEQELNKLTSTTSLAARVRRLLLEKQSDFPSLQVTARLFHMTPRTLHRRLEAEGSSFREIQEEVRRALAVEHLRAGRLSVQEIAYALGYTDIANFRRAFKRWEQVAPSAYRQVAGQSAH